MIKWLKNRKFYKNLFEGKEGASFISVIIGVTFLATLGITILTIATRYMSTVIVEKYSSDNFYQTEGILEEVRTGLLEYADTASETAYTDVLENYTKESENMKDVYSKKYLSGLATVLRGGMTYSEDDIKNNLGTAVTCSLDVVKKLTKKPDAVQTVPGTNLCFVTNYDDKTGYTLTIKNLLVDYTDDTDYRSSIQSDIVFQVPDYKFEGDSTLNEIKNYIVINDDQLKVQNANIGIQFIGNVYTGNKDTGIDIGTQSLVNFNSKTIISRGNLDAYTGSVLNLNGESGIGDLWLQNIRLLKYGSDSSLETKVTLNENAYISNDLDIQDNNATVNLGGKYYGYSYNEQNDSSRGEGLNSEYSSAILVNGLNTTLNANSLDKMILAGRAFVSQNKSDYTSTTTNILTGESLSIKSNQLAYLVPDSCIPESVDHNPMAIPELTATVESDVKANLLSNAALKDYLNPAKPYIANYIHGASGDYVYLFLNFASEAKANEYFKDYYTGVVEIKDESGNIIENQSKLKERAQSFLSVPDMGKTKFSGNLCLIAANIVYNYEASAGSSIQSSNYYNSSGAPRENLLQDGRKIAMDYLGKCKTLLSSGGTGRDTNIRLDDSLDLPLVSSRIIDFSKVDSTVFKDYSDKDGNPIGRVTVVNGDRNVTSADSGLLIVKGDVTVDADFKGLILASGKVTVTGNHKLEYDMITVGNLLEEIKYDDEFAKYFYAFNGGLSQDTTEMNKCVFYQNWVKNAY